MSKKEQKRRSRPDPTIEQLVEAHVVIARVLLRSDAVYDTMVAPYLRVKLDPGEAGGRGTFEVRNYPGDFLLAGILLYLAIAWQVIATWGNENTDIQLHNDEVDAAIKTINPKMLKGVRNSVLHAGRIADSREDVLMAEADEILAAVRAVMGVMRDYLRARLGAGDAS